MTIFVIFRTSDSAALEESLKQNYPEKFINAGPGQYLVSATGTPKEVSDKLGISEGKTGTGIIFSMGSYFGRATTEIWDWIKNQAEKPSG